MVTSAVCAVHCAMTPLLGVTGAGLLIADERLEQLLALAAVLLVVVAMVGGLRAHGKRGPALLACSGILLLLCARTDTAESHETWLSVGGAILLIAAHAGNLMAGRRAERGHAEAAQSAE